MAAAAAQGEVVKNLKADDPTNKEAITAAVAELKRLKDLIPGQAAPVDYAKKYNQAACKDLLTRKFFFTPSFEIYGGCAGFYDYGPLGFAVKQNVENLWRNHFILEEDMLEVGCTNIVLDKVLQVSGHVGKFSDLMIKDTKTGTPHRADKLIQEHINKVLPKKKKEEEKAELTAIYDACEAYNEAEIDACVEKLKIKDPVTNNPLTKAERFNLMFGVDIGPTGHLHGYLRPETAQGIFVNYRRLLEYNNGKMPFSSAQIGMGYRNEIHPKQGLLRTREFQMGEIEHFYDPQKTDHPKFAEVAHVKFPFWTATEQEKDSKELITNLTIGEAVAQKIVKNETLAYFMTRTYMFLVACGIKTEAIRFRQHKGKEMAHYANDCWDAEVECSYEWVEVAGHADRSAFDLEKHQAASKCEMFAARPLA
jgi:glycyl-tRNA synthetase